MVTTKGVYQILKDNINYYSLDEEFREITKGRNDLKDIVIGIADTGIYYENIENGYLRSHLLNLDSNKEIKNQKDLLGKNFHGTHVAGQAAFGTKFIKLVDIEVQKGSMGTGNAEQVAKIISSYIDKIDILSCSISLPWEHNSLLPILGNNCNKIFLLTAGNGDVPEGRYTVIKELDNCIIIGGVDNEGNRLAPSERGYGKWVHVLVPSGPNINVYDPMGVSVENGVSFGIPLVANVIAKMKLINEKLTPKEIKELLIGSNYDDIKRENLSISEGVLDPVKAYQAAENKREEHK